jgi:hypothetical protein
MTTKSDKQSQTMTIAQIKEEIDRIESKLKATHWGPARTGLRRRLWNFQGKLEAIGKEVA